MMKMYNKIEMHGSPWTHATMGMVLSTSVGIARVFSTESKNYYDTSQILQFLAKNLLSEAKIFWKAASSKQQKRKFPMEAIVDNDQVMKFQ